MGTQVEGTGNGGAECEEPWRIGGGAGTRWGFLFLFLACGSSGPGIEPVPQK